MSDLYIPTPTTDDIRREFVLRQDPGGDRTTEQWWAIRDAAYEAFDRWEREYRASIETALLQRINSSQE